MSAFPVPTYEQVRRGCKRREAFDEDALIITWHNPASDVVHVLRIPADLVEDAFSAGRYSVEAEVAKRMHWWIAGIVAAERPECDRKLRRLVNWWGP